jgi:adenine-specific DNA-methyltransferase
MPEVTKEKELLKRISELEAELKKTKKQKKYGLVWEEKPEQIAEDCGRNVPILRLKEKKKGVDPLVITDSLKDQNILIEGDNYHALSVLNYTHTGRIDAIYIDPPYNTGAKNWVYNNDYVDANDAFRHSKWLSFMNKRLKIAKPLLKDDGIIVVTIDDYEIATLTLLMNEIFGEENYLGTVVIKNNPQGRSSVSGFQVSHEYALFYGKTPKAQIGRLPRSQEQIARYKESDSKGPFEWRNFRAQYSTESLKMKYPIFVKKDCSGFRIPKLKWNLIKQKYDLLEKPNKSEIITSPIDPNGRERTWKWSIETVEFVKGTEMGVRLDKDKNPAVYYKGRMKDEWMLPYTIWDKSDYSASALGANLLTSILGSKKFDYPKSLYALMDSLLVATEKKDAIILDFFAGSGTTGHAVLELNKHDEGNRKFILCTNNESNICEEVTYERIKKVIKGYKNNKNEKVNGLGGNLHYYKTDLIDVERLQNTPDQAKVKIAYQAGEMIGLREGTLGEIEKNEWWQIFEGAEKMSAIYFKEDKEKLPVLIKLLEKNNKPTALYIFSWGKNEYKNEYSSQNIRVEDIPEPILEVYREINRP